MLLRCEHCRVFLERCLAQILNFLLRTTTKISLQVLTARAVARLAQARYPAQIIIFFKMKMASPAICIFEEYPGKLNLLFSAPLGCKSFLGGMH